MIKIRKIKAQKSINNWLNLRTWRPYFIIFVVGFLLYSQTLFFKFTYLDDNVLVLRNAPVLQSFKNIGTIFSTDVFLSKIGDRFYYRPLLNLSLMLDNHLAGTLPFIYHLDNIILHIIATGLIFYLLYLFTRRKLLAFFLALIFLVHPVLSQAVAWVPGRNDSLLAILVLSAFSFFLNFLKRPRISTYLLYLFSFFLALLTKESAIVLPFLVIYYFLFISKGNSLKTDRWLLVIGSGAVASIWFLMRHLALGPESINYFSILGASLKSLPVFLLDLGKILLPVNLAVFPILKDSSLIYGIISLILLIVAWFLSKQKRRKYVIFGILWFSFFLLPSLINFDKFSYSLEHRLYVPMLGFLLILTEIDFIKNLDFQRRRIQVGALIVLLILSGITFYHSKNFRNRLVFWQSAVASSPDLPLAQRNLGVMYYFNGNYAQAEKHDFLALSLNKQEPMVHNNLGVIYMNQKKYKKAEQEFKAELKINPGYSKALENLQDLYYQEKSLR